MKPHVMTELMQRKYLKTVGATQSCPHMVPREWLQGEERAGLSRLLTSAEHNSAPYILPEQFGKGRGTKECLSKDCTCRWPAPAAGKP